MGAEINYPESVSKKPKKRVLFVITQSEMGGAQRFFIQLLSRLDKNRFEALVAVGADGDGELFHHLGEIGVKAMELKKLKRDISPLNDLLAVFELKKIIRDFRADTVFLNSSKAGFVGALAAKFAGAERVIYRIGGWSFNDPRPAWQKKLWIFLEKISASWKDVIILNNQADFNLADKLKIRPREKSVVIHNGLDLYKTDLLEKEEARVKLFEKAAKKSGRVFHVRSIVGTIANFYPPKGLEHLISAAEHFKNQEDVMFFVIGDGQSRPELEKMIEEKGLRRSVILLGKIPNASRYLSAFDIFVLPSVKEGFPWALLEAMAARLPVIATNVGAVPEIIEDGKNGFIVEPARPEKIAEKILELINSDKLRQEFGIQAHQTVLFKFELDKMVRCTEELL